MTPRELDDLMESVVRDLGRALDSLDAIWADRERSEITRRHAFTASNLHNLVYLGQRQAEAIRERIALFYDLSEETPS